ncbi:MAG: hypothetical protein D6717_04185 [Gammaproteobacteria bacterium]|nr:MAG: hypothetical protein D6717_04185 [Gammaproteobacteria bacterium]
MKMKTHVCSRILLGLLLLAASGMLSAAEGWPVVCRPDAKTHLVYTPADGGWLTITGLRPAPRGARERLPAAGQCAFYDRPMNRDGEKTVNGRLEFTLRLPTRDVRNLQVVPLGRGSSILARNGRLNDFFRPILRGQVFRFMARRTGRGKYEITSLDYDTSRLGRGAPRAVPAPSGSRSGSEVPRARTASGGRVTARPAGPAGEDCLSFNRDNLRVKKIQGRWKIVDGHQWLFDFDGKRNEADQAMRLIRHYRMDSVCYVGRPHPGMTYLLSRGRPPRGSYRGEDCVSFNPNRVEARRINGRWKVVEGSHWVFDFGNKAEAARQAVQLIRKYGFRKSCFVGRPDPSFEYLRK